MNRLVTTFLLLSSYCVPTFLGDAGLHELFCIEHHGSHRHTAAKSDCDDSRCHQECPFQDHSTQKCSENDEKTPGDQRHSDEDNCSLCQHVAKSQIEIVDLEIESDDSLLTQTKILSDLSPRIACVSLHDPRGPPALL